MNQSTRRTWLPMACAVGAGIVGTALGALTDSRFLWPLVMTLLIYPLFYHGVRSGRLGATVGWMMVWAFTASVVGCVIFATRGLGLGQHVIQGPAYAEEMLHWVRTGEGPEGSPALYLPLHARHYAAFLVASAVTGSFAGLYFGTLLLNYMNFYVASLAAATTGAPALAWLLGWPIWAIIRVVGFVAGGTALGHLFVTRILRRGIWKPQAFRRWMLVSLALVVLDVLLKAVLAEAWRQMLLKGF